MDKHYGQFINTKDNIMHLLYAAYYEDMYGQALLECNKEFGEDITYEVAKEIKRLREQQ